MSIDTRFPPLPGRIRVQLYPGRAYMAPLFISDPRRKLLIKFCEWLKCTDDQVILTESASSGLYGYLLGAGRDIRIALPAFSCTSLVEAIIQSGNIPVFYDIDTDASINDSGVDFAIANDCKIFIWPNLFGHRKREAKLLKSLSDNGVSIIADEAQSEIFTRVITDNEYKGISLVLFSLGYSKWLPSGAGGVLYFPTPQNGRQAIDTLRSRQEIYFRSYLTALRLAIFDFLNRSLPRLLSFADKRYDRLDRLMAESPPPKLYLNVISAYHASKALRLLNNLHKKNSGHIEQWLRIRSQISRLSNDATLSFLQDIHGPPSILALKVSPDKRFEIMSKLSDSGVQSTWYYYPLPLVERYAKYASQNLEGTTLVASSVIILPFQWLHHQNQINKIYNKLSIILPYIS